jgi:hypothetical protein
MDVTPARPAGVRIGILGLKTMVLGGSPCRHNENLAGIGFSVSHMTFLSGSMWPIGDSV